MQYTVVTTATRVPFYIIFTRHLVLLFYAFPKVKDDSILMSYPSHLQKHEISTVGEGARNVDNFLSSNEINHYALKIYRGNRVDRKGEVAQNAICPGEWDWVDFDFHQGRYTSFCI